MVEEPSGSPGISKRDGGPCSFGVSGLGGGNDKEIRCASVYNNRISYFFLILSCFFSPFSAFRNKNDGIYLYREREIEIER